MALAAWPFALALLLPQASPAGRYELYRINRTPLPYQHELPGTARVTHIRSGTMRLAPDDRFEAAIVLVSSHRGQRSIDTLFAQGTWAMRGDTAVVVTYTWRRGAGAPASDRATGPVTDSTVALNQLGFINPWWLGARTGQRRYLRFRRVAG